MYQYQRHPTFAALEVTDQPSVQLDLLRFRPAVFLGTVTGHERGLKLLDHRIDFRLAGFAVDHDAEQRTHRQGFILAGDLPTKHPGKRCLDTAGNFVGFDIQHFVALGDSLALLLEPDIDPSLGHGQAPLGHSQGMDLAHERLLHSISLSTALSIFAASGM